MNFVLTSRIAQIVETFKPFFFSTTINMLEEDELDFEDFGDLGEYDGQEMTTEELEKQLAMEFPDLPTDTISPLPEPPKPILATKETVIEGLDEGEFKPETPREPVKQQIKQDTPKEPVKQDKEQEKEKPVVTDSPIKPRNSNNNNYQNNFQHQQNMAMK